MENVLTIAQVRALCDIGYASVVNITSCTNAEPINVLTATAHGCVTGDMALVVNMGTATAANKIWRVTKVDDTHVTLDGSTASGVGSGGQLYKLTAGLIQALTLGTIEDLLATMRRVPQDPTSTVGAMFPSGRQET